MIECIDRKKINIHDGWLRNNRDFNEESTYTHITFAYANQIANIPLENVVQKRTGEWFGYKQKKLEENDQFLCSVCKTLANKQTPYCPYCGAEMRLNV